jgi:hypothetical protein
VAHPLAGSPMSIGERDMRLALRMTLRRMWRRRHSHHWVSDQQYRRELRRVVAQLRKLS